MPWAAARDEGLKVTPRWEKKARSPREPRRSCRATSWNGCGGAGLSRGVAKKAGVADVVVDDLRRE
jgi:hypothetical protein